MRKRAWSSDQPACGGRSAAAAPWRNRWDRTGLALA